MTTKSLTKLKKVKKKSLNIALHDCLQGIRFMRDLFYNSFKMFSTASISQFLARADRRDIAPQKGLPALAITKAGGFK